MGVNLHRIEILLVFYNITNLIVDFDESCGEFGSCGAATCREHEGGSKTCVCENNQFFDSSTKTCVSSCPEGSIYVSKIDTCFKIADLNTKKYLGQGLLSKPWDEAVSHCEEQEKVQNSKRAKYCSNLTH